MKNYGEIYRFEIKKIMKNRLTVVMLIVTVLFILIEALIPKLYMSKEMEEGQKILEGAVIDDALLQEMYPKLIDNGTVWTADNFQYEKVAEIANGIIPDNARLQEYSADELYREREAAILDLMKEERLANEEIVWWQNENAKIDTPFTYRYCQGTINFAQGMSLTLMCIMLISALCLSTVFTIEHRQRTDQIVISCRNGRKETYLLKIAAGLSVVIGCSILSAALLAGLIAVLYGIDGLNAIVQMEIPLSAYSFTMGQFIIVQMIVMISAAILFAAFAMAISEVIKNSLAVMGIMVGLFIFGQLELIPPRYRVLAQIKDMLPSNQISIWTLMKYRLVGLGGHYVTTYVAGPIIYVLIAIILIVIGKVAYDRFQVTGR